MSERHHYCNKLRNPTPLLWAFVLFLLFEHFEAEWIRTLIILFGITLAYAWIATLVLCKPYTECPFDCKEEKP